MIEHVIVYSGSLKSENPHSHWLCGFFTVRGDNEALAVSLPRL